eukprot:7327283-Alexandrium_andersonii.AAC.1
MPARHDPLPPAPDRSGWEVSVAAGSLSLEKAGSLCLALSETGVMGADSRVATAAAPPAPAVLAASPPASPRSWS